MVRDQPRAAELRVFDDAGERGAVVPVLGNDLDRRQQDLLSSAGGFSSVYLHE
jgi:hypothetical protein